MAENTSIPELPNPSKVKYSTFFGIEARCPWCGSNTSEWDSYKGPEHDADCCGNPVIWELGNNLEGLLKPVRTEADKRYLKMMALAFPKGGE